jgi:hypothetical protein
MAKISEYPEVTTLSGPEEVVGNQTSATKKFTLTSIFNNVTAILQSIAGDARGTRAIDWQQARDTDDEVASGNYSFIAGGYGNKVADDVNRAKDSKQGHAEGLSTRVLDWQGHAEGNGCIAEGKISHAEGNNNICVANDAHVEGNRSACGGRYYEGISTGSEDAGDGLGVKQYVLIPDSEGDVSSGFPNPLQTDAVARYGAGFQVDVKGNVYPSGMTPAVWTGDVPTTPNDLTWAMHRSCYLRGSAEVEKILVDIVKVVYAGGTGTKVYYDGAKPFATIRGILSSYAATVPLDGVLGGNSQHVEGLFANAWGYAAHAEGGLTRAWGNYSHAEGNSCQALGDYSHAEGWGCIASGDYSRAVGKESKALRNSEEAFSAGKISEEGDDQVCRVMNTRTVVDAGWWEIEVIDQLEDGKSYHFETMVTGRQTAAAGSGVVGNTFAYKFVGLFTRAGAVYTTIGTPTRTLIGRSAGMSGDGLTTGERMSYYDPASGVFNLRYDGVNDQTYRIQTHSFIQEMKI